MAEIQKTQTQLATIEPYELPTWEALPRFDLYMDQVITLMEEYLSLYKKPTDKLITPSMINNYVKLGVIPKPYKKRYNRIHLAYLVMVCSLKQILSISDIQKLLPLSLSETEIESAFNAFRDAQKQISYRVIKEIGDFQKTLSEKENATFSDFFQKAVQVALTGNIYKLLSEIISDQADSFRA